MQRARDLDMRRVRLGVDGQANSRVKGFGGVSAASVLKVARVMRDILVKALGFGLGFS